MGYMHIDNLYKNQDVLMFKELYALEKIHGTSAHFSYKNGKLNFSSGGAKHERFVSIFNVDFLFDNLKQVGDDVVVYGEAYGGKMQGMSATYGPDLKFVAFEVKIDDLWLSVPQAEQVVKSLGLEFVDYVKISSDMEEIDKERDRDSVQAIRNGMGEGKKREGIVLKPLMEFTKNNGQRIIVKHKGDGFSETKTKREVSPEKLKIIAEAKEIAEEWVTEMRLTHVLDKLPQEINIQDTKTVINAMIEDVLREAKGEIIESKGAMKAIGSRAAFLFKRRLQNKLYE